MEKKKQLRISIGMLFISASLLCNAVNYLAFQHGSLWLLIPGFVCLIVGVVIISKPAFHTLRNMKNKNDKD